jgi:hypothetical protein
VTGGILVVPIQLATLQGEILAGMDVARATADAEIRSLQQAADRDLSGLADTAHGQVALRIQREIGALVEKAKAQLDRTAEDLHDAAREVEQARFEAIAADRWVGGVAIGLLAELAEWSARRRTALLPNEVRALERAGRSAQAIRQAVEDSDYDGLERAVDDAWSQGRFPGDAYTERFYAQQLTRLLGGKHLVVAVHMLNERRGFEHWPSQDRFRDLFARATFGPGGLDADVTRAVFHPNNVSVVKFLADRPRALSNRVRGQAAAVLATTGNEHQIGTGSPEPLIDRLLATGRSRRAFVQALMENPHLDVLRLRNRRLQTLLAEQLVGNRDDVYSRVTGDNEPRVFEVFAAASGSEEGRAMIVQAANDELARALSELGAGDVTTNTTLHRSVRYWGASMWALREAGDLENTRRALHRKLLGAPVSAGLGKVPGPGKLLALVAKPATDRLLKALIDDVDYAEALRRADIETPIRQELQHRIRDPHALDVATGNVLDLFQGAVQPGKGVG